MSCGSNSTTHQSGRRPTSVIFKKKWKTSHFILSRRRASGDFHEILHGDRGGPCHHFRSYTFLDPINSFSARGRWKFGWKRPHRCKLFIILLFIEIKLPNLEQLCRLKTHINLAWRSGPTVRSSLPNFTLIGTACRPCGAKYPKTASWVKQYRQSCLRQILPVIT